MGDRLAQYLARLGLGSAPALDPPGLAQLQHAHRRAFPFENLDILLGRAISIDSASVFDKMVMGRRGGYCFEQNRLFADMLAMLGLATRSLLARVMLRQADGAVPPQSHVLLLAEIGGESWILDVGFGGSDLPPLPLRDRAEAETPDGARYRLFEGAGPLPGYWLLERAGPQETTDGRAGASPEWQAQYAFSLAPVADVDLEVANHWTSTRPESRFTSHCLATRVLEDGFAALEDRRLRLVRGGNSELRELAGAAELHGALEEVFGLQLSPDEVERIWAKSA